MSLKKIDYKKFIRIYGVFIGILVFLFMIDFGFIRLSQKKWTNGLKESISEILEEKQPNKWIITKNLKINSCISTNSIAFELQNKETGKRSIAVIIRTTTLFGAYPALYIYNSSTDIEFIGYACIKGRVKTILEEDINNLHITYWSKKIGNLVSFIQETNSNE